MISSDDETWSAYLGHIRDLADQLVRADDPYDVAIRFMEDTVDVLTTGEYAGSMYTLWGALTDWVELKPDEETLARQHMVKAARDWLALNPLDSNAVRGYFDHWLYDVMRVRRG